MKKTSRIPIVFAIVCIILGALMTGAGIAIGGTLHSGWGVDFGFGNDTISNEKVRIEIDAFENLEIDISKSDVEIKQGDAFALFIEGIDEEDYQINQDNKTLQIKQDTFSLFNMSIGFNIDHSKIILMIPENVELEDITIDASAGDITIYDIECFGLSVDSSMGDIELKNVFVNGDTTIDQDLGDIHFTGRLQGDSTFDSSMGDVEIKIQDSDEEYTYACDTSLGDVDIKDAKHKKKNSSTNSMAQYAITVDNSLGDIKLEFER